MLTPEQITQIKEQLLKQIESWPDEQKAPAKAQIEAMDSEQLEEFLNKNNLVKQGEQGTQECIFCSITKNKIPGYKIAENKSAIAILEINPISKGHIIIIPKAHVKKEGFSPEIKKLAQQVGKLIQETLSPKNILIEEAELFEHGIINIIPVYKDETSSSPRNKADEKDLQNLLKKLTQEKPAPTGVPSAEGKPTPKPQPIKSKPKQPEKLEKAPIRKP